MTSLKIDEKADLKKFLKILVEESITQANAQLIEDREQKYYEKQMAIDKKRFETSNISEDDKDVEATAAAEVDEEESTQMPPTMPEEETEVSVQSSPDEDIIVNYFRIRDELNTIRSGNSLKDDETKMHLEQYVDKLSDPERKVLYTFLKSIASIMTSQETGDSAQDPSEPPTSITIGVEEIETQTAEPEKKKRRRKKQASPSGPGAEDTAPPIQVGKQVTESIRKKVRELMAL